MMIDSVLAEVRVVPTPGITPEARTLIVAWLREVAHTLEENVCSRYTQPARIHRLKLTYP